METSSAPHGDAPSVSVAIGTYNGARFLRQQLDSIAAQTRLPIEVVICDDGSTDGTVAVAEGFATSAPFDVRVIRNETNLGFRGNFMKAAGLCRGDVIALCDQDDLWSPDKLARIAAAFADPETLVVAHEATLIDENRNEGAPFDPVRLGGSVDRPGPWPIVYGFAISARAAVFAHADLWQTSVSHFEAGKEMGHDRWIVLVALALGKLAVVPAPLTKYRQHGANVYGALKAGTTAKGGGGRLQAIRSSGGQLVQEAAAAANRRDMLVTLARRRTLTPVGTASISRYDRLAADCRLRAELHRANSAGRRAALFARLVAAGAYRRQAGWGFDRRRFLHDLLVIVPLGGIGS